MTYPSICGKCLHSKTIHEEHNGHFMYCGSCLSLCDKLEFDIVHKSTSLNEVIKIQLGREHSPYIPKEIKESIELKKYKELMFR